MKRITLLLALLAPVWAGTLAAPPSTNRVLIIDPSSTAVSGAKATLSIGPLQRTGDIYAGDYQMKVSPYFFKSEKGRLAIVVTDESLAKTAQGIVTEITGTATSGKSGTTRHIDAIATPASLDRGTLKLWFMSGERKMIFEPAYHFAEKETAALLAQTNLNSNMKRRIPVTHREAREAATKRP